MIESDFEVEVIVNHACRTHLSKNRWVKMLTLL